MAVIRRLVDSIKIRIFEFPLTEISDSITISAHDWTIPSHCYQTWVDKNFGKTHACELKKFRELNPEISWHLFDDGQMDIYMRERWSNRSIFQIYSNSKFGPMRADIFRYCLLYDKGGYYFDIGKGLNKPIRSFHDKSSSAMISFENNICITPPSSLSDYLLEEPCSVICQWGFGFAPNHPFLAEAISLIERNYSLFENVVFRTPKEAILTFTGPGLFTQAVRNVMTNELADSTSQCGIDFMGHGISALPGSNIRYFTRRHYTESSDSALFK